LEQGEDSFPSVDWEDVWAVDLGDGKYEVANVPFYAQGIGSGDIVSATSYECRLVFKDLIAENGHSTIHVIVYDEALTPNLRSLLAELSCSTELSNLNTYFFIDVPPNVDYEAVRALLDRYASEDRLDYQESALRHSD